MNARVGVWAAVIVILAAAAAIAFGFTSEPGFTINDRYIETTPQGTIAYYFVETKNIDTNYLTKIGKFLKSDYAQELQRTKQNPQVTMLLGQFYRPQDAGQLTNDQANQMNIPPTDREKYLNNLQFVEKGYVYREFIGTVPGMPLPGPSVIPAPIVVPKKGRQIKDLIQKK